MMGEMMTPVDASLLAEKIESLIEDSRRYVVTQVNFAMVRTYFEIGRAIVENEQSGELRAGYGKRLMAELSLKLTERFGKGFSQRNLEQMRQFYLVYSGRLTSPEASSAKTQTVSAEFSLSWSHYLFLMRIDNQDERNFYEREAIRERWSLRELKRQFGSALYERLALSRDKEAVAELPTENPTVGLVLCKKKDDTLVELTLPEDNRQIFASKYQTVLPNKEELARLLDEKMGDWAGGEANE